MREPAVERGRSSDPLRLLNRIIGGDPWQTVSKNVATIQ